MKVTQKIALLKEHANLVGAIPTMKGLDKIKALKRLSEIIVVLGGRIGTPTPNTAHKFAYELGQVTMNKSNPDEFKLLVGRKFEVRATDGEQLERYISIDKFGTIKGRLEYSSVLVEYRNGEHLTSDKSFPLEKFIAQNDGKSYSTFSIMNDDSHRKVYEQQQAEFEQNGYEFMAYDDLLKLLKGGETADDEQSKLDRLTQIALNSDDNSLVTVKLSTVDEVEAKKLKQATGLDLHGYTHEVDNYAIKHTFKQHGNQAQEESRGQVAITENDIALIPDIIKNYDTVEYADKTKIGRDTIKYSKTYNDTIYYVEEVRDGKKGNRLTMQTMYKRKGSVSHTSETISAQNGTPSAIPLNSTIPKNPPIVNIRQTPLPKQTLSAAFTNLHGDEYFSDGGHDDDTVLGIDDLDGLTDSEQRLMMGRTVAFGRAIVAIDELVKNYNDDNGILGWAVVFGDFNHTLSQGLFDAVKISPSLFYVVAQVKSLDNIIRLAVSDTGEIIAYVGASGATLAKRSKVHYSNAKKLQSLITEALFKSSQKDNQ